MNNFGHVKSRSIRVYLNIFFDLDSLHGCDCFEVTISLLVLLGEMKI